MPFAHTIVLGLRRGAPAVGAEARAQAKTQDKELFHAADDVALFLQNLPAAEQLLRLGAAGEQGVAFRDSSYRRLALLHVAQGRWSEAQADLARTAGPGARVGLALYATLPFVGASPAELKEIRGGIERWNPEAEPPWAGSALELALAPHLRHWLLAMLDLGLGADGAALLRAGAIERMPAPPGAAGVVRSLTRTLRASVAAHRNRVAEALRLLEPVRGEVPAPLLRAPFYAEEPARYLRAELLQRLGRDREALDWLRYGFADTPTELAYLAPSQLRQGEIHERLGERDKAVEHYQRFLGLWEHSDPALQPLVTETRSRLARLVAEPRADSAAPRR